LQINYRLRDKDTYLFIISDHGIKPLREFEESGRRYHSAHDHGGNTPVIAKHDFEDGDDVPGSFIAIGPNIKKDVRLMGFTVSVFDIAPTILKLYGIPQPTQMKGHVLSEIFESQDSQAARRNTNGTKAPSRHTRSPSRSFQQAGASD
jgi:arylsulfatase A-like enzyme